MLDSSHSSSGRTESAMVPSPGLGEVGTFGTMVTSCIPPGPGRRNFCPLTLEMKVQKHGNACCFTVPLATSMGSMERFLPGKLSKRKQMS